MFRRSLVLIGLLVALAGGGLVGHANGTPAEAISLANPCGSGYTHAIIGGEHKCLRRGRFCAIRYDRQYRRYGFHCHTGRLR